VEEAVKALGVAGHHLVVIAHAGFFSEETTEHGACMVGSKGNAGRCRCIAQPLAKLFGALEQGLIKSGLRNNVQGGKPGGHGDGVARQSSRLVHRPERRDMFHDLVFAAEGAHRHAATDDLAQCGEVGFNAVIALRAGEPETKARHYLIQD